MSRYLNRRYRRNRVVDINMAPLIDMIFILLIFFLVTTSFVKDAGVEIERPELQSAQAVETVDLVLAVDAEGQIVVEGRPIDVRSVRALAERYHRQHPQGAALILADKRSETGILLAVLDACRLAGLDRISVGAKSIEGPR